MQVRCRQFRQGSSTDKKGKWEEEKLLADKSSGLPQLERAGKGLAKAEMMRTILAVCFTRPRSHLHAQNTHANDMSTDCPYLDDLPESNGASVAGAHFPNTKTCVKRVPSSQKNMPNASTESHAKELCAVRTVARRRYCLAWDMKLPFDIGGEQDYRGVLTRDSHSHSHSSLSNLIETCCSITYGPPRARQPGVAPYFATLRSVDTLQT